MNRISYHTGTKIAVFRLVRSLRALAGWGAGVVALVLGATHAASSDVPELQGPGYRLVFDAADGAMVSLTGATADGVILRSGDRGLWQVRFRDGSALSAADFGGGADGRRFSIARSPNDRGLLMTYESPELTVVVTATSTGTGIDLVAALTPHTKTVLEFAFPGQLRFDPQQLTRCITPLTPHQGVGAALGPAFFNRQRSDSPVGWQAVDRGPRGYVGLLGAGPLMHAWDAPAVGLRVTSTGRDWLGPELSERLNAASALVNRPFAPEHADLVLVDSDAGPYIAASSLGGSGRLWRVSGRVDQPQAADALRTVEAVVNKVASGPGTRTRLALVAMSNGPAHGEACAVSVDAWRDMMRAAAEAHGLQFEELDTPERMVAAAARDDCVALLNPYGEALPVPRDTPITEVIEAIRRYVRSGGNWFEVGGYSFYGSLRPVEYLRLEGRYPPLFADFLHLDTTVGSTSIYGVQPRTWEPWAGRASHECLFVPGRLAVGGDDRGGWCERAFGTHVPGGERWTSPHVRIVVGTPCEQSLQEYCRANGITRPLDDKLSASLAQSFRQAVLVKYMGTAREQLAALDQLPRPALIHLTEYLKGGFDKEYPDHLPPSPRYGTPAELRALFDRAHELGHLVVPYTNPTWWCDHPRGPTFEREGEAPLLRDLEGKLSYERYGRNDGYTTCLWHPAVQRVNRETVRQFTEDYPVDILFQDQCGARTWQYDTNPAAPTPWAYAEGMISMVEEDACRVPLGTEDGFDRIVNAQVQLCGFTFALVPGDKPAWARPFKELYPPGTWQIYPVAQHIAHDKTAMLHHDLGKFVTDRRSLSWTLGLGFAMSYAVRARDVGDPRHRAWLGWLDRMQKSLCARYVGQPVRAFQHERPGETGPSDGLIRATYGPVQLIANLGPDPCTDAAHELAGYGFWAEAPDVVAGNLRRVSDLDMGDEGISFVAEAHEKTFDIWIYAPGDVEVAALLPRTSDMDTTLTFDNCAPTRIPVRDNAVRMRLPKGAGPHAQLWHAVIGR